MNTFSRFIDEELRFRVVQDLWFMDLDLGLKQGLVTGRAADVIATANIAAEKQEDSGNREESENHLLELHKGLPIMVVMVCDDRSNRDSKDDGADSWCRYVISRCKVSKDDGADSWCRDRQDKADVEDDCHCIGDNNSLSQQMFWLFKISFIKFTLYFHILLSVDLSLVVYSDDVKKRERFIYEGEETDNKEGFNDIDYIQDHLQGPIKVIAISMAPFPSSTAEEESQTKGESLTEGEQNQSSGSDDQALSSTILKKRTLLDLNNRWYQISICCF
ncbi:hypothetical protein L2E82_28243 [Cichorium intybus]|uniref:Uncharacterized protein n=1 Tax=Cichorium intybus TaxID=13427 RepID=A0ACB9CVD9_CICIN|nr:hypothetical protein L2E82_28243 [Cichorium intybus]